LLEKLRLLGSPGDGPLPSGQPAFASGPAPPRQPAPTDPGIPAAIEAAARPPEARPTASGEVVIDLDADDGDDEPREEPAAAPLAVAPPAPAPSAPAPPAPARATGPPAPDWIADIRSELSAGNLSDARRRLSALVVLGYAGPDLDQLRREVEAMVDHAEQPEVERSEPVEPAAAAVEPPPAPAESSEPPEDANEDLSAIRAALEGDLFAEDTAPILPEEPKEQGVDEMLAEFRDRVEEEVDAADHRMHYELGIGFKEMGLIDEAIREFRMAVNGPDLRSEASGMIAVCHRERQEADDAIEWYRAALESAPGDSETSRNLRYDLAEVLLESGETRAALDEFRVVMEGDPTFRDVSERVSELESRLQS
jgi:tetratricopeptide (TPR) repeat protein